ncbi:hypothetical protein FHT21_000485 [Pedobacter sp. SG908]|nr:hypothetical protein [Pedobacter sp. SG908]
MPAVIISPRSRHTSERENLKKDGNLKDILQKKNSVV